MAENQEIFDNARITELALKWKALTKENRHGEAMPILEEIIRLCEHMFLRLAQYEGFTNTVDLSTLVQSAREKVPRWLIGWDPTYKSNNGIFSWLSKCQSGDTRIFLADGTLRRIDEIVDNKQNVDVLCWDETSGKIVSRPVIDWSRQLATRSEWRKLSIGFRGSLKRTYRCLYMTADHPVWHARRKEWVAASELEPLAPVLFKGVGITDFGKSVLTGIVLGDGCVDRKKGAVCYNHGGKQLWYTSAVSELFRKNVYDGPSRDQYGNEFKRRQCVIPTMEIWPEGNQGFHRGVKCVNQFLLDHITPVALAYWYMDDGSITQGDSYARPTLHTESFTREECQKLQDVLLERFGLVTEWKKRAKKEYGYIILKDQASADKFFALVSPWILTGFAYKLPSYFTAGNKVLPAVTDVMQEVRVLHNRPLLNKCNIAKRGQSEWFTPDFTKKYDIEVEGAHNFLAEGLLVHNCSKHAFLSEIAKLNQHRRRFHATGDNLEKFFGAEDHNAFKDEAANDVRKKLADITVRWGDPQEIGAVRYILECLVEDRSAESKPDKEVIIKSASYAHCISPDLSRFFYDWALFALRDALHHKIHVPFTQQDLLRNRESYTFLVDMIDIVGWDRFKRLVVTLGGQRLRLPTLQQLARLHSDYLMSQEIDKTDLDPESVEQTGKKHGRSAKAAAEIYEEMVEITNPRRSGEHSLYPDPSDDVHDT